MENILNPNTENFSWFSIFLVLALVLISAFFSLVETALASCSRAKMHRLAKEGDKKAIKVEQVLKQSESAMSTILLCNNGINIMASAIATSVLIKLFGETGVVYATIIMTILVLVFGEIAPKTYALRHAEKIILFSAPLVSWLVKRFYPITNGIQNAIDKTFDFLSPPAKHKKHDKTADLDEIRGTIDLKHKAGSIVKYDKDMLDSILNLDDTEIANVMVHRKNMASINIAQSLDKILKRAFEINHSRIPLWRGDEDNIVAILNMRKLITVLHNNHGDVGKINLKQFTSEPWFVPATNTLKNQLVAFRSKKEKFAIVIDEYGALMGVITLEDILEEIVGDLDAKEDNQTRNSITKFKDGSYKISGELPVRDINRKLNWNLPEDDEGTATLAGLLISKSEKIPEEGEQFEFDGFRFKVMKIYNNRILFLRVHKI
ncbi:MAG: Co2 transporter containing domain [Rickettsiaceae bacterium]|jgi:Mg2+/Co2+ transporter CorB|nr:Co2 transporter containing domain [Rickettsiaceae bacterium]